MTTLKVPREIRRESESRMKQMIVDLQATDLNIRLETWLGEPFVELTLAVQPLPPRPE